MSTAGPAYGQGQREVSFGSVEWAEAAARDFQRHGYRRRTRGLVPGDVLVAETAEGFSVFWLPCDVPLLPGAVSAGGRRGQGMRVPPSPGRRGGLGEGRAWDQPRGGQGVRSFGS